MQDSDRIIIPVPLVEALAKLGQLLAQLRRPARQHLEGFLVRRRNLRRPLLEALGAQAEVLVSLPAPHPRSASLQTREAEDSLASRPPLPLQAVAFLEVHRALLPTRDSARTGAPRLSVAARQATPSDRAKQIWATEQQILRSK